MFVHLLIAVGIMTAIFVPVAILAIHDNNDLKRRRKKYAEERSIQDAALRREIEAIMQRAVIKQQQDESAIGVPVTACDRRERRRILKLET